MISSLPQLQRLSLSGMSLSCRTQPPGDIILAAAAAAGGGGCGQLKELIMADEMVYGTGLPHAGAAAAGGVGWRGGMEKMQLQVPVLRSRVSSF